MTAKNKGNDGSAQAGLHGPGAIAQGDGAVAASGGGVAVGRDVHGDVIVNVRGENVRDKELAYLKGLLKRYEYWQEHYTPLAGIAEVRAAVEDGPRLDLPMPFIPREFEKLVEHGYGPRTEVRREPVDDLRTAVRQHRRVILLGDPGSGKTTTLWRMAHDYATAARDDARAPLPVFAPLGGYTDDEPFGAYLGRHLGPLAPYLDIYRASGRLTLLLDGLNEMPQVDYAERVRRIQEALDRCAHQKETVVVTCRPLDYVVKLKRLQKVEVAPLDGVRIRAFVHNYLGDAAGERLFWRMAGHEARVLRETWQQEELPPLLAMGRNPYLLLMMAQVYANKGKLPTNRAQMFHAFVDTLLGREKKRHLEDWITVEHQKEGLAALAYAMQAERDSGTTVERKWAEARLCQAVPGCNAGRLLYLTTSATLLDADEAAVRFYHQLLQEYFAAREMMQRIADGEPLTHYWSPDRWWEPSGWEETAILMAGMAEDATALLERLAQVNPVVAARCLLEGEPKIDDESDRLAARSHIINSLSTKILDVQKPEGRRTIASELTRLRWLDDVQNVTSAEGFSKIVTYLETIGRFVSSSAERDYLVEGVTRVLDAGQGRWPDRQQAFLLFFRAAMWGQLRDLDKSAADYIQAQELAHRFVDSAETTSEDQRLYARILLGYGNIVRDKANALDKPEDRGDRQKDLQDATALYKEALHSIQDHGKPERDIILEATIYNELSITRAWLGDFEGAEAHYRSALRLLAAELLQDGTEAEQYWDSPLKAIQKAGKDVDLEPFVNRYALFLENASYVRWEKGQYLAFQGESAQALKEYESAHTFTDKAITMLNRYSGECEALTVAYLNDGDYLLEMAEHPACLAPESHRKKACERWRTASNAAHRLGLVDLRDEANKRLEQYSEDG